MDDEDDRRLLDILGDVEALNDYLHGNNSKSIGEDDVANAAYGSDGSFFSNETTGCNSGLKDGSSGMAEFEEDPAGAGLHLSSSLSFMDDDLEAGDSPDGADLEGEDQPFDILQKSLLEADITEQTLAQEALLDSQPAPNLVQAPVSLPSQLVSGGYGGGVVTTAAAAFPAGQVLQGVSPLANGSTQHIQVLGSFGGGGGVMTLSGLERTPQIVLRPGLPVAPAGSAAAGQVFAPTQGQVSLPFKNIPLQNIIIQRGPGGTQAIVRPIQPKPPPAGSQTVFSLGLQPPASTLANVLNANAVGQYTANGSIVVQPSGDQQQVPAQTSITPGQFLLPNSLTLTPSSSVQNGSAICNSSSLITTQNTMQLAPGQSFSAPPGGQLILNQGVVSGSVTQTWTSVSSAPVQTACAPGRLTLVGSATIGIGGQGQASSCPVQRLLVTQTQNCTSLSPLPSNMVADQKDFRQSSLSPAFNQAQPSSIHALKTITHDPTLISEVPLTRTEQILHRLKRDHAGVQIPNRRKFSSIKDALERLLSYHVFQGAPPCQDEFSQVDQEFEDVASQVVTKTQTMINKYRRLLMVEAERSSPSSEMVMIDRTFNQEERSNLTQDKRTVLVDPDGFLDEFCCGMKSRVSQDPVSSESENSWDQSEPGSVEPPHRTDFQPGFEDPGGGGVTGPTDRLHPPHLEIPKVAEPKRPQQNPDSYGQGKHSAGGQPPHLSPRLTSPPHPDADSALEAAVNSILEC
ncbi:BRD4-interacting chromatin-remodeling complex-associated protein-like [Cyprinodon tularosa]|uniref:BRD4-interacting chromatin-remodeling complex-associated protein-like n=1 Tax=Cyprinodon tularosa TaxID=77115 RepID=UPI0018E269A5|nr:BRD4-interacting chromatin-remodeling complex-associated protein-like [Cyprinodon tularosa]